MALLGILACAVTSHHSGSQGDSLHDAWGCCRERGGVGNGDLGQIRVPMGLWPNRAGGGASWGQAPEGRTVGGNTK
jgi:hypothetical protein